MKINAFLVLIASLISLKKPVVCIRLVSSSGANARDYAVQEGIGDANNNNRLKAGNGYKMTYMHRRLEDVVPGLLRLIFEILFDTLENIACEQYLFCIFEDEMSVSISPSILTTESGSSSLTSFPSMSILPSISPVGTPFLDDDQKDDFFNDFDDPFHNVDDKVIGTFDDPFHDDDYDDDFHNDDDRFDVDDKFFGSFDDPFDALMLPTISPGEPNSSTPSTSTISPLSISSPPSVSPTETETTNFPSTFPTSLPSISSLPSVSPVDTVSDPPTSSFDDDYFDNYYPNKLLQDLGNDGLPESAFPLGECEGDCDDDSECAQGLTCFRRSGIQPVPGCSGSGISGSDYCVQPSLKGVGNNGSPSSAFPLGQCEGDCDSDAECEYGLICFQRNGLQPVPGCSGSGNSGEDYCIRPPLKGVGNNGSPSSAFPLGQCEGDCDNDAECADGLICFQRDGLEAVPGCSGSGVSDRDYCIQPPLIVVGNDGRPESAFPLEECEGDCDNDDECANDLICFQRNGLQPVPGCNGSGTDKVDYCIRPSNMRLPGSL